jgi:hypothetical protein
LKRHIRPQVTVKPPAEERTEDGTPQDRQHHRSGRDTAFYCVIAIIAVLAAYGAGSAQNAASTAQGAAARVVADEHATCVIQKRGLPAGHALSSVIGYIHALLTLPPTPEQRAALAALPRAYVKREQAIILALNRSSALYTRLEGHQPLTRTC